MSETSHAGTTAIGIKALGSRRLWLTLCLVLLMPPAFAEKFTPIPPEPEPPPGPKREKQIDIVIDCHDIALANTSSADPIKVEVFDDAGLVESKRVNLQNLQPNPLDKGTCSIAHKDGFDIHWFQKPLLITRVTSLKEEITVHLTATGSDAIWIDRLRIYTPETKKVWDFGVDGKKGWCLSTKSSDSFGSDRQNGKCKKCIRFSNRNADEQNCGD